MTSEIRDGDRSTDHSTTDADASNDLANDRALAATPASSRRGFMKTAAAGTLAATLGITAMTGQTAAVTTAQIKPSDGFADVAPWLENENPTVYRVSEATRSAVEAAFHASGPRVVVFETSGTINLGGSTLEIANDKCWVAGQTAPSPGITFVEGTVKVGANDCVVQHVRSRVGPGPDGNIQGNDSFNTADGTSNNVADHVTASWGVDECMSVGYDTDRTTYTNCLIYEGLHDPYGDGSDHNYCTLVGDNATNVALLGNVWAKARSRIPRLKAGTTSVVANNFAYFFDEACNTDSSAETAWVGNTYAGLTTTGEPIVEGSGTVYAQDNATEPPLDADVSFVGPTTVSSPPLWPSGFSALAASEVESTALANAGARPADRTEDDARIIQEIRDRAGSAYRDSPYDYWIADHTEVGGYPTLPENTHTLDVPSSGLRDWLAQWSSVVETGSGDPGGDTTAPTTPTGLTVTATTTTSVDVSWSAASDSGGSGLAHYNVYLDGSLDQQVSAGTTSATISSLSSGTSYQVTVSAADGAGNESGQSSAVTATTDSSSDTGSWWGGSDDGGSDDGSTDGSGWW